MIFGVAYVAAGGLSGAFIAWSARRQSFSRKIALTSGAVFATVCPIALPVYIIASLTPETETSNG